MSAIFGGTSYLSLANPLVGASPSYVILMGGLYKSADTGGVNAVVGISDNANSSQDQLRVVARWDDANNILHASAVASGTASNGSTPGLTPNAYQFAGGVFNSITSRRAIIGSSIGNVSSTSRSPTGLSHTAIGAILENNAAVFPAVGEIAEVFVAVGFTVGNLTTIVNQLAAFNRPIDIAELAPFIVAYQPLRTGLNDPGYIGPSWTNNGGVTFNANVHPIDYGDDEVEGYENPAWDVANPCSFTNVFDPTYLRLAHQRAQKLKRNISF